MTGQHPFRLTREDGSEVSAEHVEELREAARREVDRIMAGDEVDADLPERR